MHDRSEAADRTGKVARMLWENPVRRAGTGCVAAVALSLLFQFTWASPREAWLAMQRQELQQVRVGQAAATRAEERLAELLDDIAHLSRDVDLLASAYPLEHEAPALLRQLYGIAEQSGMTLVAYAPRSPEPVAVGETALGGTRWTAQLELTGHFHDFAGFLDRIRALPRMIRVGELAIRVADPAATDGKILATGTAETLVIDRVVPSAGMSSPPRAATAVDNPAARSPGEIAYDPGGRRDPFRPLLAEDGPVVPEERPAGLPGIAASELSLRGFVVVDGVRLAVLESPNGRSWLVRGGENLLDGVIGIIGTDEVRIRTRSAGSDSPLRLLLGATPTGRENEAAGR